MEKEGVLKIQRQGPAQRKEGALQNRTKFWHGWLMVMSAAVMVFGSLMMLAPELTRNLFSVLLYSASGRIDGLDPEAVRYITLAHGVLGAVMFAWGLAIFLILSGVFRRERRKAWNIIALSLAAWYLPDTLFSLWTGFWQNALLNTVLAALFALPLAVLHRRTERELP